MLINQVNPDPHSRFSSFSPYFAPPNNQNHGIQ
jgi:hypothetical protein